MNSHVRHIVITVFTVLIIIMPHHLSAKEEYSLEDLYRIALERSERIKISEEDLYISERGKEKAFSVLLPKFSAFWDYTKYGEQKFSEGAADRFIIQPRYSTSWGVRLDQSISLSGRELTALKISKEDIEKSKYELYAVKEEYIFGISSDYYDVLRTKKAVDIAKANVERLTKHRDAASLRLKVGEVTKTALLRAEAELSGAQSELVKAENNLQLAKAILARFVGLTVDYKLKEMPGSADACLFSQDDEGATLNRLKEIATSERAELRAVEIDKKIADAQMKYAQGAYWPTLSIEGVYSRMKEEPFSPFFLDETIYAGFNLNFPFFEGGLRKAEVEESKAKQRKTRLALEDIKKTIIIEVENAYRDFITQKGVLKSFEDQLTFAMDNYNAVSKQFTFGLADSIEVMDANTLFVTAERQLADARYNYQLSVLRVERTTGTLLKRVMSQ